MAPGILFYVVGPSGSGKDTLIDGARDALSTSGRYVFARRVITRPVGSAGEDHEPATEAEFVARETDGGFLIAWRAHGLRYGLPTGLLDELAAGRHVVANGSRAVIESLATRVPRLVVVEIWAPEEVLAARIAGRGRESGAAIDGRLARTTPPVPAGIASVQVANDADPATGIEQFVSTLHDLATRFRLRRYPVDSGRRHLAFLPANSGIASAADYLGPGRVELTAGARSVRAEMAVVEAGFGLEPDEIGLSASAFAALSCPAGTLVTLRRTPSPASRDALRRKVRGAELCEDEYEMVVRDIVEGRYPEAEVAGFLVASNRQLSDAEVVSLARVRARYATQMRWDAPIVVDKHSMGGIPGSRITMVVPLVAAHGLTIPKTSSRAITSAAGTADAMEALARVDLTADEVLETVARARGCIAWNGRLSHSALDDVMNAITRPLGLDSARWSVASILSKKLAAGSTHVVIDLPWGPGARLRDAADAGELARLFELAGSGLGLTVSAVPTDGRAPIGRGIGPALEVRDVLWVLENHSEAPADLREKALSFAARILAWDPAIGSIEAGRSRAESLLASGAARDALDRIVEAQGRRGQPARPGAVTRTIRADRSGIITALDGFRIGGLARSAGAPGDKGAGIDLLARPGETIRAGDPLFLIHSSAASDIAAAAEGAARDHGYRIDGAPADTSLLLGLP
jgi:thymidine phosphorylase